MKQLLILYLFGLKFLDQLLLDITRNKLVTCKLHDERRTTAGQRASLLIPIIIARRPCRSLITSPILSDGTNTSTS